MDLVGSIIKDSTSLAIKIINARLTKQYSDKDRIMLVNVQKHEKSLLTATKTKSIVTFLQATLSTKNTASNIKDILKDHEFPICNGRIIDTTRRMGHRLRCPHPPCYYGLNQ